MINKKDVKLKNNVSTYNIKDLMDIISEKIDIERVFNKELPLNLLGVNGKKALNKTTLVTHNGENDYVFNNKVYFSDFGTKGLARLESDRITLFATKGVVCKCCGLEGSYFKKNSGRSEQSLKNMLSNGTKHVETSLHLNLYSEYKGEEILMTKDHIVPRSKGGTNCNDNYDVCCTECNFLKSNSEIDISELQTLVKETKDFNEFYNKENVKAPKSKNTYNRVKNRIIENGL